ncbi:FAD-binding oxidoreductase [Aurantiacibacter flavus]|uniref:FAD-binding oxidoreductase n=1 Tax=Aurantiacibacter flavus TaxID=3145232 RepID=A0ABV0CRY2_9SPHN
MPVLPPGLTQESFDEALDEFRAAIGAQWVFTSDADRASYLDPFDIGDQQDHASAAALAPADVEGCQKILAIANRFKVPLWPVSMGKNFAYGTAAPEMRGSVILDLKRMNRILEINEEMGTAVVEPGVSFFDFKAELDRRGSRLWMSGPAHSWGSVIGNALEHGVGYTPYGQHAEQICGMEVLLADGTLVRTGLGALEGTREWQAYRWPFGPALDGLFTQSNFAIVTKMGLWLMPEPEGMAGVSIRVPRKDDFRALVDTLRPLRMTDTINAPYTIANGWRQITGGRVRAQVWNGPGAIPPERMEELLEERGNGWWSVIFNLFDSPAGLDLRLDKIRRAFAEGLPDATIEVRRWQQGDPQEPWMRQEVSLAPLGAVDWGGSPGGHSDLGPIVAPLGDRAEQVYDIIERRFLEYGKDPWVGMFGISSRALVFVADMYFTRTDAEDTARCRALFRQLCEDMQAIGVGLYRTHLRFMDDAAAMHAWGDHALPRLNDRIKTALDPNGILAPGKQGIGTWDKQLGAQP